MSGAQTQVAQNAFAAFQSGEFENAAQLFHDALLTEPSNFDHKAFFLHSLFLAKPALYNDAYIETLTEFLKAPTDLNIGVLIRVWVHALHQDEEFAVLLDKEIDFSKARTDFLGSDFFNAGLTISIIPDVKIEKLLTRLRSHILEEAIKGSQSEESENFAISLAQCCFINEYVFAISEEEKSKIPDLKNVALKSKDSFSLAVLACYMPLYKGKDIVKKLSRPLSGFDKEKLAPVIQQQIKEPLEEEKIKKKIKHIGSIQDDVSRAVQEQYEENPYPTWINIGGIATDEDEVDLSGFQHKLVPKILIAGCATGRYPIGVAKMRPNALVYGVDLSTSSIAYATRKAKEIKADNLSLFHCDILNVGELGENFDMIETVGVLHHMDKPMDGLHALVNILEDGGYIKIGLYSTLARRHLTACQEELKEKNIADDADGIREARAFIMGQPDDHPYKKMLAYDDFYSVSMLRDLLMHKQEHCMTMNDVMQMIEETDLEFLGFAGVNPETRQAYAQIFPDDLAQNNLQNWADFEEKHPDAFIGMYKFWCKKI